MYEKLPNIFYSQDSGWSCKVKKIYSRFITALKKVYTASEFGETVYVSKKRFNFAVAATLSLVLIGIVMTGFSSSSQTIAEKASKVGSDIKNIKEDITYSFQPLEPLEESKSSQEVFGFAPYWTINKLDNVDFETLTTLAYFSVTVREDGSLDRSDRGYEVFKSREATRLFKKAHAHGTRVVLTITQMKNPKILALLNDEIAQGRAIEEIVNEVKSRGIDGVNIDIEYSGNPGNYYREKFSNFVARLSDRMHQEVPGSYVTVSVYAVSAKGEKLYDIEALASSTDGIFMMAYDFAVKGSEQAIPTAPLYGYQEGKYWYDISTAVDDFLQVMPPEKLILGVPWYGYNYLVYEPEIKAETRPSGTWRGSAAVQTYSVAQNNVHPNMNGITDYREGWDDYGKVGWKAYFLESTKTWRMIFLEDVRSLSLKFDFAKEKNLGGVGMWALGFDHGRTELWELIRNKFGTKLASTKVGEINEIY